MTYAAQTASQVGVHFLIAFGVTYAGTGSAVFGGVAALLEPLINVALLPLHEKAWLRARQRVTACSRLTLTALQKLSQTLMHMSVAFAVMFLATGSVAFGGLAAVIEPVVNVIVLPFVNRVWERPEMPPDRLAPA